MGRLTAQEIKALAYSIKVLDNEALRIRGAGNKERRGWLYYLINKAKVKLAIEEEQLIAKGYYEQTNIREGKEESIRIFVYGIEGIEGFEIYDLRKLGKQNNLKNNLGEVGLIPYDAELQLGIPPEVAETILKGYTGLAEGDEKQRKPERKPTKKTNKKEKKKGINKGVRVNYPRTYKPEKTTLKHVAIDRLEIVLPKHLENPYNEDKKEATKGMLASLSKENKGMYPENKAILVWKRRDTVDKRRTVYHIEDGYIRYVAAKELGFKKIWVRIIEED